MLLEELLKKLFPYSEISIEQHYGIISIYLQCSNFCLFEFKTDVYRKSVYTIAKESANYFIDKLIKFTIDENEYNKLLK